MHKSFCNYSLFNLNWIWQIMVQTQPNRSDHLLRPWLCYLNADRFQTAALKAHYKECSIIVIYQIVSALKRGASKIWKSSPTWRLKAILFKLNNTTLFKTVGVNNQLTHIIFWITTIIFFKFWWNINDDKVSSFPASWHGRAGRTPKWLLPLFKTFFLLKCWKTQ